MVTREVRDFVRSVLDVQKSEPKFASMVTAKSEAARMLGVAPPSDAEFNHVLATLGARRGRGRPKDGALTKGEAVAAVAVYFESVGAGREQATNEAKRWLGVSLSRRVAKAAVEQFKANTAPDQFKPQAIFAYAKFGQSAVPLPESMQKVRKRRRPTIRDLG